MEAEYKESLGLLTIKLRGDLDMHSATHLRDWVTQQLSATGATALLINLGSVQFMDSSGLGFVLGRYRCLQERGGKVILAAPRPQVQRVLNLSGVGGIIPIFDTEEAAYQAWKEVVASEHFE